MPRPPRRESHLERWGCGKDPATRTCVTSSSPYLYLPSLPLTPLQTHLTPAKTSLLSSAKGHSSTPFVPASLWLIKASSSPKHHHCSSPFFSKSSPVMVRASCSDEPRVSSLCRRRLKPRQESRERQRTLAALARLLPCLDLGKAKLLEGSEYQWKAFETGLLQWQFEQPCSVACPSTEAQRPGIENSFFLVCPLN